jgi:hypothetical protein
VRSVVGALVAGGRVFVELVDSLDLFACPMFNHAVEVLGVDLRKHGQLLGLLFKSCVPAILQVSML